MNLLQVKSEIFVVIENKFCYVIFVRENKEIILKPVFFFFG